MIAGSKNVAHFGFGSIRLVIGGDKFHPAARGLEVDPAGRKGWGRFAPGKCRLDLAESALKRADRFRHLQPAVVDDTHPIGQTLDFIDIVRGYEYGAAL